MRTYEKQHIHACYLLEQYKPISKYDFERLNYCKALLERNEKNNFTDAGVFGKVLEVTSRPSTSRLVAVQSSHKCDSRITIEGRTYRLECKCNGGRIEELRAIKNKQHVAIHYVQLYTAKNGKQYYANVIMRLDNFLDLLDEKDATKTIEHKNRLTSDREEAIQGDSKALWKALQNELEYNREWIYYEDDNIILNDFEK